MVRGFYRYVLMALGFLSLIAGFIGIFLPIMPTAPFLILAAICFSKTSPRWHQWLLDRPKYGPVIRDWEQSRIIPLRAKILASVTMLPLLVYPFFLRGRPLALKAGLPAIYVIAMIFIWTRPHSMPGGDDKPSLSR